MLVQPSCQNAEVVEAFCRVATSRSNTRRSIHQPPVAALHAPAEMLTAFSSVPRYAEIHVASCSRRAHHRERRRRASLIALAAPSVPNFPRLRALALFGRRPVEPAERPSSPASKNHHTSGLMHRSRNYSITSSALASNEGGTVRQRLALFRHVNLKPPWACHLLQLARHGRCTRVSWVHQYRNRGGLW